MAETPAPAKRSLGEKRLAAIVFTDVVSFSARVQQNESLTLRLVKRDFEKITETCNSLGGQVLKTTGDGLLMSFPTAGAAVDCAMRVQRMMAHNAKRLPSEQVLQHRIGIHLGDVFIDNHDVLGNDVNITARVMSEAGAGDVCVTQTVYDVVRHRLQIKGIYLGQRALKNISEPVSIFKLPLTSEETKPAEPAAKPKRRKWLPAVIALLVLVAGGAALWFSNRDRVPGVVTTAPVTQPASTQSAAPTARFFTLVEHNGQWKGLYGATAALVFGDEPGVMPKEPLRIQLEAGAGEMEVTLVGGNIFSFPPNFRGHEPPPVAAQRIHSSERFIGGWSDPEIVKAKIRFPDDKVRRLTVYTYGNAGDSKRVDIISIFDPTLDVSLANRVVKDQEKGVFVSFFVSGTIELRMKVLQGKRTGMAALFIDPAPAQ